MAKINQAKTNRLTLVPPLAKAIFLICLVVGLQLPANQHSKTKIRKIRHRTKHRGQAFLTQIRTIPCSNSKISWNNNNNSHNHNSHRWINLARIWWEVRQLEEISFRRECQWVEDNQTQEWAWPTISIRRRQCSSSRCNSQWEVVSQINSILECLNNRWVSTKCKDSSKIRCRCSEQVHWLKLENTRMLHLPVAVITTCPSSWGRSNRKISRIRVTSMP